MKKLFKTRESIQLSDENSAVKELSKYENGTLKANPLSDLELNEIREFEAPYMSRIESMGKLKSGYMILYPEYYITPEGKKYAQEKYGVNLESDNIEDITKEILEKRHDFSSQKYKGEEIGSGIYIEERMFEDLNKTLNNNGEIDISNISIPKRIGVVPKPENIVKKLNILRSLKNDLKKEYKQIDSTSKIDKAKQVVIDIYLQKINSLLANLYDISYVIHKTAEGVGLDKIDEFEQQIFQNKTELDDEKKQINLYPGYKHPTRNISQYDKFKKGVENNLYDGNRRQIGKEIDKYKEEISKKYLLNELSTKNLVEKKGLDYDKLMEENIKVEKYSGWIRDILTELDLLTKLPEEEWGSLKKNIPTDDGKYRFKIVPKKKSISYNKVGRCLLIGDEPKSIVYVINKMLSHEITHVLQHENKKKVLEIELLRAKGSENSELFTEGGAMGVENLISEEFFGFENIPHPHFINSMKKRYEGCNYLECLKAFYDSTLDINRKKLDAGAINSTEYEKNNTDNLKLAINRTLRIFRPRITDLSDKSNMLTNSKNSIYVEQLLLAKELNKNEKELIEKNESKEKKYIISKYMMVAGTNLDNFVRLAESGLIDMNKIKELNANHIGFIRNLWDTIKGDYIKKEGGE